MQESPDILTNTMFYYLCGPHTHSSPSSCPLTEKRTIKTYIKTDFWINLRLTSSVSSWSHSSSSHYTFSVICVLFCAHMYIHFTCVFSSFLFLRFLPFFSPLKVFIQIVKLPENNLWLKLTWLDNAFRIHAQINVLWYSRFNENASCHSY